MNVCVGLHRIMTRLSAQGHLCNHDRHSQHTHKDKIGNQEGKTAVSAHQIGKLPEVPKPDCRSRRGHDKSQLAGPLIISFHTFSPYFLFLIKMNISPLIPIRIG